MTMRERLADWISGGALSRARTHSRETLESGLRWMEEAKSHEYVSVSLQARLDRIAAMETPGANATVRRMARVARGEK